MASSASWPRSLSRARIQPLTRPGIQNWSRTQFAPETISLTSWRAWPGMPSSFSLSCAHSASLGMTAYLNFPSFCEPMLSISR
jgi:hypothetical protein